jgi:hypothetical protein
MEDSPDRTGAITREQLEHFSAPVMAYIDDRLEQVVNQLTPPNPLHLANGNGNAIPPPPQEAYRNPESPPLTAKDNESGRLPGEPRPPAPEMGGLQSQVSSMVGGNHSRSHDYEEDSRSDPTYHPIEWCRPGAAAGHTPSNALHSRFTAGKRRTRSQAQLLSISQNKGEGLGDYLHRFSQKMLGADDCSDKVAIAAFTNGLRDKDLVKSLYRRQPTSFDDLMMQARSHMLASKVIHP